MIDLRIFFEHGIHFLVITTIILLFLYQFSSRFNLQIIDPINFYFVFNLGTSYAVVILMHSLDIIDNKWIYILGFFAVLLFLSIYLGYYLPKFKPIMNLSFQELSVSQEKKAYKLLWFIYLILVVYYITKVDWAIFFYSRFEANKGGLGSISRLMDVFRLFIISYWSIYIFKAQQKRTQIVLLGLFSLISSVLIGSKYAILESFYTIFLSFYLHYSWKPRVSILNFFKVIALAFFLLSYALQFTKQLAIQLGYTSTYTEYAVHIELLIMRVLANGDTYYLGLPYNIVDHVSDNLSSFTELIFRPYLGSQLTHLLFGSSTSDEVLNIGRAIWEFWYPNSLKGGGVDHFDLFSYSHLGVVPGGIFILVMGFFIGRMNKYKMNFKSNMMLRTVFLTYSYNKLYVLLLSPSAGISLLMDGFIVFLFCHQISRRLR